MVVFHVSTFILHLHTAGGYDLLLSFFTGLVQVEFGLFLIHFGGARP